jgi:hypothetical protein
MEITGKGIDEEIEPALPEHILVILIDPAPEFLTGLIAPFGKEIGDGDDLKLMGHGAQPAGMDIESATTLTRDGNLDDFFGHKCSFN